MNNCVTTAPVSVLSCCRLSEGRRRLCFHTLTPTTQRQTQSGCVYVLTATVPKAKQVKELWRNGETVCLCIMSTVTPQEKQRDYNLHAQVEAELILLLAC